MEKVTIQQTHLKYPYYVKKHERRVKSAVKALSDRGIGHSIYDYPLDDYKSSDTVFIFGSGSSINEITGDMWEHIRDCDSIGLNRWPIHDFVPTFYFFEWLLGQGMDRYDNDYLRLISARSDDYDSTPMILKSAKDLKRKLVPSMIPDELIGKIILASNTNYNYHKWIDASDTVQANKKLLEYLSRIGRFRPTDEHHPFYGNRGSISYLIHFAMKLGYNKIILCGVDMINSKYFWDENREYYESKPYPIPERKSRKGNKQDTHRINDSDINELTLEEIIYQMNEFILNPNEIELFVENSVSALHPEIPEYSQL
jgi:hypothetical protein